MTTPQGRVLIVDDEEQTCKCLTMVMDRENLSSLVASDGETALKMIRTERPDVMLLDINLPGIDGMQVIERALKIDPDLMIVPITGDTDIHYVVLAMRLGAYDFLAKPFSHKEIIQVVAKALAERDHRRGARHRAGQTEGRRSLPELMGPSKAIEQIEEAVNCVAQSNFTVVIQGETGVGKELVARAIHEASPRARGAFVPVDSGAIPDSLLESELFGYEKGAFTGADGRKAGKFELAQGGTLFLDEIANLTIDAQAKLLRALQEKVIYRVGGSAPVGIDVRILAAGNQDLQGPIARGEFRHDLFFRLNEFTIRIPPLRERKEDILYLAKRFLELTNAELHKNVKGFSEPVIDTLLTYRWPGNVRQLRSTIRRAVLLAEDAIAPAHLDVDGSPSLSPAPQAHGTSWNNRSLRDIVQEMTILLERNVLSQTLRLTAGNKAKAARMLKIDYKTIHSKVRDYGIIVNGGMAHG